MKLVDVETLDLSKCAVLVIRGHVEPQDVQVLGDDLLQRAQATGQMAPLIIMLHAGEWMESLDEDQMRANGWVRA